MKTKSILAALTATSLSANAAITFTADSSAFDYRYEMDVNPSTQDLNGGGGVDWYAGVAGSQTIPQNYAGGLASSDQSAASAENLFRGDFDHSGEGSIWRELVKGGAASAWTLEVRVQKRSGTQGANGWFGIATANLNESNSSALTIMDDRIRFTGGADYLNGSDFTTGFQTIRIAHDAADNAYYYWINDTLLNVDLATPIAGTNGSAFDNNTFIGDYSTGIAGEWDVDYIRIAKGAFAPVPEPTAAMLLSLGGLVLTLRRRK